MTTISALGSLGLYVARHYNAAAARADHATRQLASGNRIITAADDPSGIGRIEALRSRISELKILNSLVPSATGALSPISSRLGDLLASAQKASSTTDLRALVTAMREAVTASTVHDVQVLAGDPANPETETVTHPATSGSLTGAVLSAPVKLSRQSVNLTVDGTTHVVKFTPGGTYTAESAATALRDLINSQTTIRTGVDVDVAAEGGRLVIRSLSTGSSSTVTATGGAAEELGLTTGTSVAGTDARTEDVPTGYDGAYTGTYAGRSVTFENFSKLADQLEAALDSGNQSAIDAARSAAVSGISSTKGSVDFAINRSDADVTARVAQLRVAQDEFDRLTKVDRTEATLTLVKSQVQMEQAAWALRSLQEGAVARSRMILGID